MRHDATRRGFISSAALTLLTAPAAAASQAAAGDADAGQPLAGAQPGVGLFARAAGASIIGPVVHTSGFSAPGEGAARYIHDPAVDAAYLARHPRTAFRSQDGRGFRLDPQQRLTIQMFGGRADGTPHPSQGAYLGSYGETDNAAALLAALDFLSANEARNAGGDVYRGAAAIHFPAADGVYDFRSQVEIRHSVRLTGDGSGTLGGVSSSILRWRSGMHGLVFHFENSSLRGAARPTQFAGGTSTVEGLHLFQHREGNRFEAEDYHGIYARSPITVRDFGIFGWSGAGIYGLGGVPATNVNNSLVENGSIYGCEHGIHVDGGDGNVWVGMRVDSSFNRGYGILDSGFLGNTWIGCHTDGNGLIGGSAQSTIGAVCSYQGRQYYVRKGKAELASTTAPSGTNADNVAWGYYREGGPDAGFPSWSRGSRFREGGAYRTDSIGNARSLYLGCYAEGSQGACYFDYPTILISGLIGTAIETSGATVVDNVLGVTNFSTPVNARASLRVDGKAVVGPRGEPIPSLRRTFGAASSPAAEGVVVIENAASPSSAELLRYCDELHAKLDAVLARMRAHGLIAS